MPAMTPGDDPCSRFFTEPRRALLTPSASPSVGPPDRPRAKRPRLRSTPSSAISATPSTSNESTASAEVNSARRASTLRVLNTWAQLAERYNKRLDEDDIIDLHRYVIVKDRGAVEGASKEYHIGHLTFDSDQDDPDPDQDQEDSEQEDDDNGLDVLPPSETATDDDAPISKKELLRGVPPLSATTDAEDLREFLEAEKKRRVLAGDEADEGEMSPEQRVALRKELEERVKKREAAIVNQARDVSSAEPAQVHEVDATPTRPSTRRPPSDVESEDELALWTHDESTAIYPIARDESEQDVREVEQEVIDITESDSDEEFEAILTHPPRFIPASPLPVPRPKEVQPPLRSPPDSERGRSKSRPRSHSKIKSARAMSKSEDRPRSPILTRKPEVVLTQRRKPPVLGTTNSDDNGLYTEAVGRIPSELKGKGKESPALLEDSNHEKTPKSVGAAPLGRKRKRIASSSISGSSVVRSPAEPKGTSRSSGKSISRNSSTLPQPNDPKPMLGKDVSTPARSQPTVGGHLSSLSSSSSASKSQPSTPSIRAYRSPESESVQLTSPDHNSSGPSLLESSTPFTHPRQPSHPPSMFSSSNQGTPGLSLPAHPPPSLDPVQTQQAHYLLAQAMHQLSYLLSATMPPYAAYTSNPGQSWYPPPPPPAHPTYSTPIHQPHHFHNTRRYHTPSSSTSQSGLPPSSPVRSSVSPSHGEQRGRSQGRSKSRGRRVSFKLDIEEAVNARGHNTQPDPQYSEQKNGKQSLEVKQERGKGKVIEEFDDTLRLGGDRGSPPREVARGRTPGPPSRQKNDVLRGRSLSRR